jgi:hypothetical protein
VFLTMSPAAIGAFLGATAATYSRW